MRSPATRRETVLAVTAELLTTSDQRSSSPGRVRGGGHTHASSSTPSYRVQMSGATGAMLLCRDQARVASSRMSRRRWVNGHKPEGEREKGSMAAMAEATRIYQAGGAREEENRAVRTGEQRIDRLVLYDAGRGTPLFAFSDHRRGESSQRRRRGLSRKNIKPAGRRSLARRRPDRFVNTNFSRPARSSKFLSSRSGRTARDAGQLACVASRGLSCALSFVHLYQDAVGEHGSACPVHVPVPGLRGLRRARNALRARLPTSKP